MRLAKEEAEDARRMKHNPRSRFVTKSGPEVFAQSRIQELVGYTAEPCQNPAC
jgi:hypothetical protein